MNVLINKIKKLDKGDKSDKYLNLDHNQLKFYYKMLKYKKKYKDVQFNILGGDKNSITEEINVPEYVIQTSFPEIKDVDRKKLKFTKESIFSMSGIKGANFVADIIEDHLGTDLVITDGTSNVGSDVVNMAYRFSKINAIELDKNTFSVLKHNVNLYNLSLRVNLINGDTTEVLNDLEQDVIYIDAPWGGPDYWKKPKVQLFLGKLEISELVHKFKDKTKMFVFKVPNNYDFINFFNKIHAPHYEVYSFKKNPHKRRITYFVITVMTKQFYDKKT